MVRIPRRDRTLDFTCQITQRWFLEIAGCTGQFVQHVGHHNKFGIATATTLNQALDGRKHLYRAGAEAIFD